MSGQIDPTVPTVKALLLLDSEGKRIAVDYFSQDMWIEAVTKRSRLLLQLRASVSRLPRHPTAEFGSLARSGSVAAQANFEKGLFAKTSRSNARGEREFPPHGTAVQQHAMPD